MDSQRSQQLNDIIDLSREMLFRARENAWQRVGELEEQRRSLVALCFRHTTVEQDAPEVAASIREILRLNQEVTELGKKHQQTLGADIQTNKVGRSAQAAYRSCAR
jgi:hypothetical protein